jgi:hypothetical protein
MDWSLLDKTKHSSVLHQYVYANIHSTKFPCQQKPSYQVKAGDKLKPLKDCTLSHDDDYDDNNRPNNASARSSLVKILKTGQLNTQVLHNAEENTSIRLQNSI